jgi:hypothetical protein
MTAWYGHYGEIRVRKCREVDGVIKKLKACAIDELEASEPDSGVVRLWVDGCDLISHAAGIHFESLLKTLGPYTLEPAVLITSYDHEEDMMVIAATEDEERRALSSHRFNQIEELMSDLTAADRARLAAMATGGAPP